MSTHASWACGQQAHARHTADGARALLHWLAAAVRAIEATEGGATSKVRAAILSWSQDGAFPESCVALTPLLRSVLDCSAAARSLSKELFFEAGAMAGSSLLALSPSQAAFRGVCCAAEKGVPLNGLKAFCIDLRVCTVDAVLRYNVQLEGQGREHGQVALNAHVLPTIRVPELYAHRASLWPVDDDTQRVRLLLSYEWRNAIACILHDAMKPQLFLHALALRARRCSKGQSGPERRRFCTDGMSTFSMDSKLVCACCGKKQRLCVDVALHAVAGGCLAGIDKVGAGPGKPTIRLSSCPHSSGKSKGCSVSATLLCKHPRRDSGRRPCFCGGKFTAFSVDEAAALREAIQAAHNVSTTTRGGGTSAEHSSSSFLNAWKREQTKCFQNHPSWFAWNGKGVHAAAACLVSAIEGRKSKAIFALAVGPHSAKKRQVDLSYMLPMSRWLPNELQKAALLGAGADACSNL